MATTFSWRKGAAAIGVFAALAATAAGPASAFHGGAYRAQGTGVGNIGPVTDAVAAGDPLEGHATLWWSVFQRQHFTLAVDDDAGNPILWAHFRGTESFTNTRFGPDGCLETVDYKGEKDPTTGLVPPTVPPQPIVAFEIKGYQQRNLCTDEISMHYEGNFTRLDVLANTHEQFFLVLDVWAVGDPVG